VRHWTATLTGGTTRRRALVAGFVVVVLALVVWAVPGRRAGEWFRDGDTFERADITAVKAGQRGPTFSLATLDGGRASLADWNDRVVVLNFWATWCQPCTDEMPTLEGLWRRYRERGVIVVGINVDRGAPRALIESYATRLGLTFPILLDPESKTSNAWRVSALPATFVIRPGGDVAGYALGARNWNSPAMQTLVESLRQATPAARRSSLRPAAGVTGDDADARQTPRRTR
jgi:peroxiredoxin